MKLVIEDEAGTRSIVPFGGDAIVVGRAAAEVTVPLGERNVSRRHARFVLQNGAVFVEDLGSLTGTRVNGERITGRRKVREGDLVQIGDYDLAVVADGSAAVVPGLPPPLPPSPEGAEERAITPRVPTAPDTPPAAPAPARRRPVGIAIAAGVLALALGAAAGWAVGTATAPAPSALTPP